MKLVFDIETNGLEDVTDIWCVVAKDITTGKLYEFHGDSLELCVPLLSKATTLIGHNIVNYDLPILKRLLGFVPRPRTSIKDTVILSRLSYPDREGKHSLRAWGERLGGIRKGDFDDFSRFSPDMLAYCRNDVELTERVYAHLITELSGHNWNPSIKLEHDIARVITQQEENGFWFDIDKAKRLVKNINARIHRMDTIFLSVCPVRVRLVSTIEKPFTQAGRLCVRADKYCTVFRIDSSSIVGPFCIVDFERINIDSNAQIISFLLSKGWTPTTFTPKGNPSLSKDDTTLTQYLPIDIFKRRSYAHTVSLVGGFISLVRPRDGRISGGAIPCGTNTGRMRHIRIVNVPRRKDVEFAKEIRELFAAPPGRVLVGYDAAQLEIRILAHYINDENYTREIIEGDPHEFAARAGGLPDRELGKVLNYATIFRAGDKRLGNLIGGGRREGNAIRKRLYAAIPGIERFFKRVDASTAKGWVRGLDGRKLWLRDPYRAPNSIIQGGGAIAMKFIAVTLDELVQQNNLKAFKVVDQHDEAIYETDLRTSKRLTGLIHQAFAACSEHYSLRCPLIADVKVGQTWRDTH